MRWSRRTPGRLRFAPLHRRDWRRFWRYCRCGLRWACPDRFTPEPPPLGVLPAPATVPTVPPPAPPPPDAIPARPVITPDPTPVPTGARRPNQRPAWTAPTRSHLIGRAGRLTPAQTHRTGTGQR